MEILISDLVKTYLEGLRYDVLSVDSHVKASIVMMDNFFKKRDPSDEASYSLSEASVLALLSALRIAKNTLLNVGGQIGEEGSAIKRSKADVVEAEFFGDADEKAVSKITAKIASLRAELEIAANRVNLIISFNEMNEIVVKHWFAPIYSSKLYLT